MEEEHVRLENERPQRKYFLFIGHCSCGWESPNGGTPLAIDSMFEQHLAEVKDKL
jgi:hypothetical protein